MRPANGKSCLIDSYVKWPIGSEMLMSGEVGLVSPAPSAEVRRRRRKRSITPSVVH